MFSATCLFNNWAPGISGQVTSLGGSGGSFVIGRDCSSHSFSAQSAHSISCG